jgi:hypothetical protein
VGRSCERRRIRVREIGVKKEEKEEKKMEVVP